MVQENPTILSWESSQKLTYVNPACLNVFGYENKNEVIGKNIVDFLVDEKICSKSFQELQNKGSWEGELKARKKDDSIFDIYVSANWVIGDAGRPIALMASFNDITERKKLEEEKSIILNSTTEHIVYQDTEYKIKWCNKANADYAGLDPEDFIDKYCYRLWYGKDEPCDDCSVQEAIRNGNHDEVTKKTHEDRIWNMKADPVRDSKGNIIGAMQITNEITEKVRAEEKIREYAVEMEKINRELEDRVQKQTEQIRNAERTRELELHHRIKNNLQVISSLLNLQSGKFEDEDVNEAFKYTQNRVVSMSLVHQKLYQTSDLDSIDINDYIKDLVEHLVGLYGGKNIDLNMEIENVHFGIDTLIPLGMLINELVSNSLKYAFSDDEPGKINIELLQNDGDYKLVVSDNGRGFPDNVNVKDADSLGLQLINSLIDQINGDFELDNSDGTKIIIEFYP